MTNHDRDQTVRQAEDHRIRERIRTRALTDDTGIWAVAYMLGQLQKSVDATDIDAVELCSELHKLRKVISSGT